MSVSTLTIITGEERTGKTTLAFKLAKGDEKSIVIDEGKKLDTKKAGPSHSSAITEKSLDHHVSFIRGAHLIIVSRSGNDPFTNFVLREYPKARRYYVTASTHNGSDNAETD